MRTLLIVMSLWAATSAPLRADCTLNKTNDLKPVIDANHLYVAAKINDKPVLFIVDTGAVETVLFRDAAPALGVSITSFGGQAFSATSQGIANETQKEFHAAIDTLEIGDSKAKSVFLRIADLGDDAKPSDIPVVGRLGENFLSHYDLDIDIKNGSLTLYQPQSCESASLAYWTKEYNVADMIHYNPREPRVEMSGKLNDSPIVMEIDSGAAYSAVSFDAAGSRGVGPDSAGTRAIGSVSGIQGEPTQGWFGAFGSFALDEEKIAPAKIAFVKFPKADAGHGSRLAVAALGAEMRLGFDFLRAHHMLISHSQQKVYFSYAGGAPFSAPKPQTPSEASR